MPWFLDVVRRFVVAVHFRIRIAVFILISLGLEPTHLVLGGLLIDTCLILAVGLPIWAVKLAWCLLVYAIFWPMLLIVTVGVYAAVAIFFSTDTSTEWLDRRQRRPFPMLEPRWHWGIRIMDEIRRMAD